MEQAFNRPIRASYIKEAPRRYVVQADAPRRAELAARFGLPEILLLRGEFELRHELAGVIAASLNMRAEIVQTCVVTLEPFTARIEEQAELRFVPAASLAEVQGVELDAETLEGPDEIPYTGDVIDLGETLAEQLALALDPYPRKPGAALPEEFSGTRDNPFAVLKFKRGEPEG